MRKTAKKHCFLTFFANFDLPYYWFWKPLFFKIIKNTLFSLFSRFSLFSKISNKRGTLVMLFFFCPKTRFIYHFFFTLKRGIIAFLWFFLKRGTNIGRFIEKNYFFVIFSKKHQIFYKNQKKALQIIRCFVVFCGLLLFCINFPIVQPLF